jgi:hypothetical protein
VKLCPEWGLLCLRMEQGHWNLGTRAEENTMEIDLHGEIAPPRSHLLKEPLIIQTLGQKILCISSHLTMRTEFL